MESDVISRILLATDRWGASDVFICVGKPPAARVHGGVVPVDMPPTTDADMQAFLDRFMPADVQARLRMRGDADAGLTVGPRQRFRFNFARQQGALSFVARAIPDGNVDLDRLGLPPAVGNLASTTRGLVLVTGATGSGKSTTLAGLLHRINTTRHGHIVTIEDPIEFLHDDAMCRITQREVGADTADFAQALRQVVRQSPDVILIGELRDLDSMQVALAAALTGHLVFASLHTIDAAQTLQRILTYFPEHIRAQAALDLSLSLQAVVSQRLVPRADSNGRVVAVELLTVTPAARRLIRDQRVEELHDMLRGSTDPALRSFNTSLLELYRAGKINADVGKAYASNPEEFTLATQGMTTGVGTFQRDSIESISGLDMKALLALAMEKGASDLHLTVGRPPIFRIAGALHPLRVRPLSDADLRTLLYSILSTSQRSAFELDRELDFALAIDREHRFRVNAYFQKGKIAAALRAIPSVIPDAADLGIPDVVVDLATRSQGLLLVVGPTGSGKSTTLACLVDRINESRACRIITVEDPIEYTHDSKIATIDQREVHADTESFAAALKYVLRQDPDVILIGEMRDLETIHAAMTAAETGHLVLATLHTNDAIQAVDRIVDVFPAHQQPQVRSQLASCLLAVVSQRLLPRADAPGRIAAFEVMVASPAIRTLIREDKMHQAISMMETRLADGMLTMDRSLVELHRGGYISRDEAMRYISNPKALTDERRPR